MSIATANNFMKNTKEIIRDKIFNKKIIIYLILLALFIGIAFYVYQTYIVPKINPDFVPNREFTGEDEKVATLYLFSVNWCPYSDKAKPIWENIKKQYNGTKFNNYILKFENIDGDINHNKLVEFENKYLNEKKIDGYPTIYMVKDNNVIEYEATPNESTLTEFINSVL